MDIAEWVGIAITVSLSAVAILRTSGKKEGQQEAWQANQDKKWTDFDRRYSDDRASDESRRVERWKLVDETFVRLRHNDDIHFLHEKDDLTHHADTDLHTSAREKDAMEKRFDKLDSALDRIFGAIMKVNGK